jgi:hypothetical protein
LAEWIITLSVTFIKSSGDISIYPYPTNGKVYLNSDLAIKKLTFCKQVNPQTCQQQKNVDLSTLLGGIYLL